MDLGKLSTMQPREKRWKMREKLEICGKNYKVSQSTQLGALEERDVRMRRGNVQRALFRVGEAYISAESRRITPKQIKQKEIHTK